MMSDSIGISTLVIMHMLRQPKEKIDVETLRMIIHNKVLAALPRCNPE